MAAENTSEVYLQHWIFSQTSLNTIVSLKLNNLAEGENMGKEKKCEKQNNTYYTFLTLI